MLLARFGFRASYDVKTCLCSPSRAHIDLSSSDGSLSSSETNNYSLPTASSPRLADDTEVLSQRILGQGEMDPVAPQGRTSGAVKGDCSMLGPQPDTVPEPPVVPDSGRQHPIKKGEPPMPMTSVHPEASDNLVEALHENHRTLMSTVIAKVQSAKRGLTKAHA